MHDANPIENEKQPPADRIRALNDAFRRSFIGGRVLVTRGVNVLGPGRVATLLARVKAFDQFTEDNDPHLEHDFGAFDDDGERFFWKIDYYDLTMTWHSPNAADPRLTCRVLTVMLAEEY